MSCRGSRRQRRAHSRLRSGIILRARVKMETQQSLTDTNETGSEKALRLPDFIHVGPPRCGTTWLHEALSITPVSPSKRRRYFLSTDTNAEFNGTPIFSMAVAERSMR